MRSRETRGEVYRQLNYIEFQLQWFEHQNNMSFYSTFGCNRPIVSIDGYDGTVHRGPFRLSRGRPILMNGPDAPRR